MVSQVEVDFSISNTKENSFFLSILSVKTNYVKTYLINFLLTYNRLFSQTLTRTEDGENFSDDYCLSKRKSLYLYTT